MPGQAIALLCAVSCNVFFTFVDCFIQYLAVHEGIPVPELICIRMAGTLVVCLPYMYLVKTPSQPWGPPAVRSLLWIRGLITLIGVWSAYISFEFLTLSEGITMYHLRPSIVILLCWLYLGERVNRIQIIACVVSMAGVILLAYPQLLGATPAVVDDGIPRAWGWRALGFLAGTGSFVFGGIDTFMVRVIGERATGSQILAMYGFCGFAIPPVEMLATNATLRLPSTLLGWIAIFGLMPFGAVAQLTLTYALQKMPGGEVAIIGYTGLVFGTVGQWVLYGNLPTWPAFLGMGIICLAGVTVVVYAPQTISEKSAPGGADEAGVPLMDEEMSPVVARTMDRPSDSAH